MMVALMMMMMTAIIMMISTVFSLVWFVKVCDAVVGTGVCLFPGGD